MSTDLDLLVNQLNRVLSNEGRRQLDDILKMDSSLNDEAKLRIIQSEQVALLRNFYLPIRFISLEDLTELKRFPRYPDDARWVVDFANVDRVNSLVVFVSHSWLRGHAGTTGWDGNPHPDNTLGEKYELCIEGIKKIKKLYAPRMTNCYVWMDYGCINQDSKDLSSELEHYDRIVQVCDCLFTPIVDPDHESWSFPVSDVFTDYGAKLWNTGPDAYLNRAWCRVEMLYATMIPFLKDDEGMTKRHTKFDDVMAEHYLKNRRPHFLFGTKQLQSAAWPTLLPPLQNTFLETYHPIYGRLSKETDIEHIRKLLGELQPYIDATRIEVGYEGEGIDGKRHGFGKMVYPDGSVYKGEWKDDLQNGWGVQRYVGGASYQGEWKDGGRHGQGLERQADGSTFEGEWRDNMQYRGITHFPSGHSYEGEWYNGKAHGRGRLTYPSGFIYEGEVSNGYRQGQGVCWTPDGDIYKGEFKNDYYDGFGVLRRSDGNVYEGQWRHDQRHGYGIYRFSGGAVYEGDWYKGARHGYGVLRNANGKGYVGQWRNDNKHGIGILISHGDMMYGGGFKDDKMHGRGAYHFPDGAHIEGVWDDGDFMYEIKSESKAPTSDQINNHLMKEMSRFTPCEIEEIIARSLVKPFGKPDSAEGANDL